MNWRHGLLGLGVLAAFAGLAVAFVPSLGSIIDSPEFVPFLLGVAAIMAAMVRLRSWIGHEDREFTPGEREEPTGVASPGADFDGLIARAPGRATGGNTRLIMIRQRLRETAEEALQTYHGHTPESAEAAIESGAWTDDQYAAEFFTTSGGAGNSLTESLSATVYGTNPFRRRARAAAQEIERLTRGES